MEEIKILAQAGDESAQFSLGLFYYDEENYDEAIYWFKKSAEKGNLGARIYTAICEVAGLGEQKKAVAY